MSFSKPSGRIKAAVRHPLGTAEMRLPSEDPFGLGTNISTCSDLDVLSTRQESFRVECVVQFWGILQKTPAIEVICSLHPFVPASISNPGSCGIVAVPANIEQ